MGKERRERKFRVLPTPKEAQLHYGIAQAVAQFFPDRAGRVVAKIAKHYPGIVPDGGNTSEQPDRC